MLVARQAKVWPLALWALLLLLGFLTGSTKFDQNSQAAGQVTSTDVKASQTLTRRLGEQERASKNERPGGGACVVTASSDHDQARGVLCEVQRTRRVRFRLGRAVRARSPPSA